MNVSVFGLGYVGCICGACLARQGHTVIGVDNNAAKVDSINAGESPIVEPELAAIIGKVTESGKLQATTNPAHAVARTDLAIISVGTPSRPNGSLDLSHVRAVASDIGRALRDRTEYFTVVVRSTVLPGTVEDLVIPTLEAASGKRAGAEFGVCMNPEFLREGSSVEDFYGPPKIVIGELDSRCGDVAAELHAGIDAPLYRTTLKVAEMVKYCDNAFHALKVTFGNEIGLICKDLAVDSHEVMDIFCADRKLNISPAYLKPGFAFGGSCLPKDLRALTYHARRHDLETPVLSAILQSNEGQIRRMAARLQEYRGRRVGLLGLSFKGGTDDLRESPLVELVESLIGKGVAIRIYDRSVNLARLTGTNKQWVDRAIPHLASLLLDDPQQLVRESDVVVVGNNTDEHRALVKGLDNGKQVVDLVRIVNGEREVEVAYDGVAW